MRAGCFALCFTILAAVPAMAANKAVNLSLFTPISLAKAEDSITALRLNLIYGKNASVKIIDLGLVNQTTTLSSGLQWGVVNYNEGNMSGLQLAAVNYNMGSTKGLQVATVNYAENAGGLQFAFVNYARQLNGFQLGAINIASQGGMFPVMVIANWKK